MARRRPLIKSQQTATVVGVALLLSGAYLLYDAYEGRGNKTPLLLRPLMPV